MISPDEARTEESGTVRCNEVQAALQLLGRSRCGAVLQAVLDGCERYSEIKQRCDPVSDALLAARLRDLSSAGLVSRRESGASITYVPTPAGRDARPVLDSLTDLVRRHPSAFLPIPPSRK